MACPFHSQQLGRYAVAVDGMDDYPAVFTCPHCAQKWGEQEYAGRFKVVPLADKSLEQQLVQTARKWLKRAANAMRTAPFEETEFGRRFIQHGGICYYNCARDIEALLKAWDPSGDLHLQVFKENSECP
ncbi:hypothetical protein [Syntrophotalea acetylenica]|uniref:hypothetical protein n=1 Tax=Syntrophotalea acetylenica TaxID=29542 RepID=UPI002A3602A3|nr:hypothetical protein [Syntrophotalea acetylenica]MDY0262018.1 hypothetical protein [Syntrophotalea acetylenica]